MAFTAAVTSPNPSWSSGNLIFNRVLSNIGNGYNHRTGVFTAPWAGTYVFYVSAVEYNKQYFQADIVVNHVAKVRLIGENGATYQTGTNMVVLILKRGDQVNVKHSYGKGYYTQSVPMTTFSGFNI